MSAITTAKTGHLLGPPSVVMLDDAYTRNSLCKQKYHGHKSGCPNFGVRVGCPPCREWFTDLYKDQVYVAAIEFDFAAYLAERALKYPLAEYRELANCLYWQGHVRKELRIHVARCLKCGADDCDMCGACVSGYEAVYVPEALGVNVTATCASVGLELEWPPMKRVFMVALLARRRE
jgi:predicted metal-binding protein